MLAQDRRAWGNLANQGRSNDAASHHYLASTCPLLAHYIYEYFERDRR
jgi:hypothetical protein